MTRYIAASISAVVLTTALVALGMTIKQRSSALHELERTAQFCSTAKTTWRVSVSILRQGVERDLAASLPRLTDRAALVLCAGESFATRLDACAGAHACIANVLEDAAR